MFTFSLLIVRVSSHNSYCVVALVHFIATYCNVSVVRQRKVNKQITGIDEEAYVALTTTTGAIIIGWREYEGAK